MKILHITPQIPGWNSGGMHVVRQSLLSMVGNGWEVDYVGPQIEDAELAALYRETYFLKPGNNKLLRIYDRLHGNTNQRYRSWLQLDIEFASYDAVLMDFTKLDYVLEKVPADRLIVRVHNVERDYSKRNFAYHKNFINFVDNLFAGRRERKIAGQAARFLVLTKKDKARLKELYGVPDEKMDIVPVCVEKHETRIEETDGPVTMILTGSLWFGPNYAGVCWFLEKVYPHLDFPKKVLIAGANPRPELLREVAGKKDIEVVDTPKSMAPYFLKANLAVAPIFDGAGMKVKVAEALSYGLPVVGTSHAFEGYEITDGIDSFRCDTEREFIEAIRLFASYNSVQRNTMRQRSLELFQKKYSMENSRKLYAGAVEKL